MLVADAGTAADVSRMIVFAEDAFVSLAVWTCWSFVLPFQAPRIGYPRLHCNWHLYFARTVQYVVHTFNHRSLQLCLCISRLLEVRHDDHLIVAHLDWHSSRTLASALPQEGVWLPLPNQRGAKSARRLSQGLLALLALRQ